jgi:hypothetical protein
MVRHADSWPGLPWGSCAAKLTANLGGEHMHMVSKGGSLRRGYGWVLALALAWGLGACGSDTAASSAAASKDAASEISSGDTGIGNTAGDSGALPCVPSKAVYDDHAGKLIADHCGGCHGGQPVYGAPSTLTGGYDSLIAGAVGQRPVDRIAKALAERQMPPVGTPPVPHQFLDTLTEWASCGMMHPDHSKGLVVDKPVFGAPEQPPADAQSFDLRADKFAVGEKTLDLYQCFTFEVPVEGDRFIRRIEAVIDRKEVVHHVVLLKDPAKSFPLGRKGCKTMPKDSLYLFAWAPGGGAVQFPQGGMRVQKGERYVLQVHYNNGAGLKDVADESGVRLWHGPAEGTEYGMIAPGPMVFEVPAKSTLSASGQCVMQEKVHLIAGMPHMHNLGTQFKAAVVKPDGTRKSVIELSGWSFEMQPFYLLDTWLEPGDRLETTCTWKNPGTEAVQMGEDTSDEMCFLFSFVSPAPKKAYCNDFLIPADADVDYFPGECSGFKPDVKPPRQVSKIEFGAKPTLTGGSLPDGRWELTKATLVLPVFAKGELNGETSQIISRGQAWTSGGKLTLDTAMRLLIEVSNGAGIDTMDQLSRSGSLTPTATPGEATWTPDCGGDTAETLRYGLSGEVLTVELQKKVNQFTLPAVYTFVRK